MHEIANDSELLVAGDGDLLLPLLCLEDLLLVLLGLLLQLIGVALSLNDKAAGAYSMVSWREILESQSRHFSPEVRSIHYGLLVPQGS